MSRMSLNETANLNKPWVFLRFTYKGKEHTFESVVNSMTGDRMSSFDSEAPSVNDELKWVKSVIRDIFLKSVVKTALGSLVSDKDKKCSVNK